ncbi:hypothetical protein [Nocardioides sp.]|uniref:hypothetical protein n=1 Tax=Nocardioides sp. TaxID=35761 RepID=UPI0035147327
MKHSSVGEVPTRAARPRTILASVLVLAGGLAVAACGADPDEQLRDPSASGAAAAVSQFVEALDSDEPQGACSHLSAEAQRALEAVSGAGDCVTALGKVGSGSEADGLRAVAEDDIDVQGERAEVSGEEADRIAELLGLETLRLHRVDDRWEIG